MSSFIIGKEEYIKAAGLLTGIKAAHDDFFVYDYENREQMNDILYHNFFSNCFTMNAISVYEQYKDKEIFTDSNEYNKTFKEYTEKGKKLSRYPETFLRLIMELNFFFHSALYQTEKEEYSYKMQFMFNTIISALIYCYKRDTPQSWGALDISEIEKLL